MLLTLKSTQIPGVKLQICSDSSKKFYYGVAEIEIVNRSHLVRMGNFFLKTEAQRFLTLDF